MEEDTIRDFFKAVQRHKKAKNQRSWEWQKRLFSQLWFNGLTTDDADGYRPSIFGIGRPTTLNLFKDGKVSVEEAFYYARYTLRKDSTLDKYDKMEPQINDQYPRRGILGNLKGLVLGE